LLVPRGTREGMPFRLLVVVTDWEKDRVGPDTRCGSASFCGARDRYPDSRSMGYPCDRPFSRSIEEVIAGQSHIAARTFTIRWEQ
jgi:tyrosinase